ncbi:helix-turn-helix domain-containing protein [Candidatus Enterococcus ferrettii]|uniref:HTH cro/C1-type domain-containing protein n=1 Tax=Candidatus Enterococcus ferrettii TaxID=2815324 RepID=A0ABV0EUM4_9ENTE|nr:helix-turn-helix transcriptional regulator [Enterococcus sp. 665A]MBO1339356.1 helix-turn-helix transcriptional regulator [Enterococcus sp. 665A]
MIGEILKDQRKKLNMTQQQVADQLHISRQTISNWETGKSLPDVSMLLEISVLFDLSLDYLIKGDPQLMKKIKEDTTLNQLISKGLFLLIICLTASLFSVLSLPLKGLQMNNGMIVLSADVLLQLAAVVVVIWMIIIYTKNFYEKVDNHIQKSIHRIIQVFLVVSLGVTSGCVVLTVLNYMGIIRFLL